MTPFADIREEFIHAATWHGNLDRAAAILEEHPELGSADIHIAAILGDDGAVKRFLATDPASVNAKSGPYGGDALNYLGLSKYLRFDRHKSDGFVRAATALLDAGADPNTGFWTKPPHPERETALYGAAGVAHHPALTKLLLDRGADPNDVEVVYHSPESHDLEAMKLVVETGKLTPESLALMLVRKHDWHDYEGVKYLLEKGADPNLQRDRGWQPLNHSLARDNSVEIIELLLDYRADPIARFKGTNAVEIAARKGRDDVLDLFERRKIPIVLEGADRLLAACARNDAAAIATLQRDPAVVRAVLDHGARRLAEFAGNWNAAGVGRLLDLGVPVDALYEGDGYFGIAPRSTALHVAAWKLVADVMKVVIDRGANVNAKDGEGRTPLMLVVKGCTESYWTDRRTPEPLRLLLAAGASKDGVKLPTGYDEADALLRA